MKMPIFAGVDGGATTTRCVIAGADFSFHGRGIARSSNPLRKGVDAALSEIFEAIASASTAAGAGVDEIVAAGVGLAGVRRGNLKDILARALGDLLGQARVFVETDALIAFRASILEGYGVVLISGTGCVAFGMNLEGESRYADGLGPFLGDDGSAHWIGMEGLRAVARELDGRGGPTGFCDTLLANLEVNDLEHLLNYHGEGSLGVARIASLAPIVVRACLEGSSEAERILDEAARFLALSVRAVAQKLEIFAEDFPIALCGGLFQDDGILQQKIRSLIPSMLPRARVVQPFLAPEYGALAIVMSQEGLGSVSECLLRIKERNPTVK
jgi:N-acetylglucosamine kinase-like BadF-type ATPase